MITEPTYIQEVKISYHNTVPINDRVKIFSSWSAADIIRDAIGDNIEYKELFYVVLVNNSNHFLGISKISEGTQTGTLVDCKMIFQNALLAHANAIILAHNHPSGKLKPSQADKNLTNKVKKAGQYLDIKVLDHIIVTKDGYFSFADEGIL